MGPAHATLTVLGSGTLLPDHLRHAAAHFVEAPGVRLLFDCGPGTLDGLSRHGVPWQDLTHVAISHYHLDHVGDLSGLLFALKHGVRPPRRRPLALVGPRGFGVFLERLATALGDHVLDPGFEVEVVELASGESIEDSIAGMTLTACSTPHTSESHAYRVDLPQGSIGYTGDTGPSEAVADALAGCRILVMECAQDDPPALDTHLSPAAVASMAARAAPGLLVLTHMFPPLTPDAALAAVREKGYGGPAVAAHDGLRVSIGALGVDPLPVLP